MKYTDEENMRKHLIFIPKCEATNEICIFFATQVEINIIFIPYLLPSIALSKSVLGPPDHESLLVLFWSHFKSAIKIFTLKKESFDHVFMDLMEVGSVKLM